MNSYLIRETTCMQPLTNNIEFALVALGYIVIFIFSAMASLSIFTIFDLIAEKLGLIKEDKDDEGGDDESTK